MLNFPTLIPLSLYIHLPWCLKKCPYCDFNSHAIGNHLPEEAYVNSLLNDLDAQLHYAEDREIVSIFFGGGTPSLFSPKSIEKILQGVQKKLRLKNHIEITLEANPGTVDEKNFSGFYAAGINRLSLGIQSLQDLQLKILGRIHGREQALRAIESAIHAGFTNFNLDLMHGLPQQSVSEGLKDLEDALQFKPPHLSWYQLTIEPNTLFHHHPPRLPEEETLWDIQSHGKSRLADANLSQYEVSAYARNGQECQHNKNYWEFGDYLGIGAGAHSKITDRTHQQILRYSQVKHPKNYLSPEREPVIPTILSSSELPFEFMLNALRLTEGVRMSLFTERTGLTLDHIAYPLQKAREKKLLSADDAILRPTPLGQNFLNDLINLFLAD